MKLYSIGGWLAGGLFLVFIAWQMLTAIFFGRMIDFFDDDEDYLFFFDNPTYFIVQFLVLAGIGAAIVHYARKDRRKARRRK